MPFICYKPKRFGPKALALIEQANAIIDALREEGFTLTLRQLYYRLVATDVIPNNELSYKRLGVLINEARLAGEVDWDAIEDRTRNLQTPAAWDSPAEILNSAVNSFALDKWEGQKYRPEVWVEKDALVGIVGRICRELGVPYFSCRGYTSQSEMWGAAQRHIRIIKQDVVPVIIHLGDHDPSGVDMSRDISERFQLFLSQKRPWPIKRIALNMDQIRQYNPPPNPTKVTDSRSPAYVKKFGRECWELDALEPRVLADLISDTVLRYRDEDIYERQMERQEELRDRLAYIAAREEEHEKGT